MVRRDWDGSRAIVARESDFPAIRDAVAAWNWRLVAAPAAALVLIGLFLLLATPRYEAEAQVLLGPNPSAASAEAAPDESAAVKGEAKLVSSRDLARRAIKDLGIDARLEFDPLAEGIGPAARTLIFLGLMRDPSRMSPEERILKAYEDRLKVETPDHSRLVTISFQSEDRDLAARAANRIADLYLEMRANAALTDAGQVDARIVSRAEAPSRPAFPNRALLLVFAASATLFTAVGAFVSSAFLRAVPSALADEPFAQPRAVGETAAFARLQSSASSRAPMSSSDGPRRAEADGPQGLAAIAERMLAAPRASGGARIVFTSLASGQGAPQMMLALGRILGREGRSIALTLDRSNGGDIWSDAPGLGDLIAGRASFAEVIRRDPASRLHFVAAEPDETIDLVEFEGVLETLARTYDFLLLAAPPLGESELAKTLASDADFILLLASSELHEMAAFAARRELMASGAQEVLIIGASADARSVPSQNAA